MYIIALSHLTGFVFYLRSVPHVCQHILLVRDFAIHDDHLYPGRELAGIGVVGHSPDRGRIEYRKVGCVSVPQLPPSPHRVADDPGGPGCHLIQYLFQRDPLVQSVTNGRGEAVRSRGWLLALGSFSMPPSEPITQKSSRSAGFTVRSIG